MRLSQINTQRRYRRKNKASVNLKRKLYEQTARAKMLKRLTGKRNRERYYRAKLYLMEHAGELGWVENILTKPLYI